MDEKYKSRLPRIAEQGADGVDAEVTSPNAAALYIWFSNDNLTEGRLDKLAASQVDGCRWAKKL